MSKSNSTAVYLKDVMQLSIADRMIFIQKHFPGMNIDLVASLLTGYSKMN